jgi:acetoin utilization deacetylase AcuC-like enzyme
VPILRPSGTGDVNAMQTGLITHPDCLGHDPPPGHPESADRLRAVLRAFDEPEFQGLARIKAAASGKEELTRVHSAGLVEGILGSLSVEAQNDGYVYLDPDTVMTAGSADAALRAAGAVVRATNEVHAKRSRNAFCAVRPPGHHAERDRAMGFCLFNNIAVGAYHARAVFGYERIAVVDFDVHHGNGTQDIFFDDPHAFYASTHQSPFYPGTGGASERGSGGNIFNVPLRAGSGSREFRAAYENALLPALEKFAPDFVFISAGFDAHRADPLAQMLLAEDDFYWVTKAICGIAASCCDGRVVSALEGGYDLDALARSSAAHVRALMES